MINAYNCSSTWNFFVYIFWINIWKFESVLIPYKFNVLSLKMIKISNHNQNLWVFFIVLYEIDSFWHNKCSLSKVLNWNLNLKFYQMDFWFEFLTFIWMKKEQLAMIAMVLNGKHKYFSNFDCFFCRSTSFLAHWIVITPY
jgi:hypothetical protein